MNDTENKPIEAYLSKKFTKKIKSKKVSSNPSSSENETQIENKCNKSKLSNFSLEDENFDKNEDDNYSVEDGSSFDSSFDEIETAEIDESLFIKTEHH